jgi:predicted peptidase
MPDKQFPRNRQKSRTSFEGNFEMTTRRDALLASFGVNAALFAGLARAPSAKAAADPVKSATAITEVFGDGQRLMAIALEYGQDTDSTKLAPAGFKVEGRTVTKVYANTAPAMADAGIDGRFVIVELSPDDPDALLYFMGKGPDAAPTRKPAQAAVTQIGPVAMVDGGVIAAGNKAIATTKVINPIVDDFQQLEFKDAKTGDTLKYNLFVPKAYDKSKAYPLVLFMHDAGVTSADPMMTLVQGLGAISFASPVDQAKREAFVLAPQYETQVVNDKSEATSALDTTIDLVNEVVSQYSIDKNRLYVTGQSGGGMMSIAMNIKYPDLFAASFLVACQWDETKVAPLAKDKLWIVVSEGDLKAYPGENAMTAVYEKEGSKVSRAVWNGTSTPAAFADDVKSMQDEGNAIKYAALKKGTVVPPGQTDDGGSNHINTWRIAYTIDGIRDWLFEQHK